MQRCSNFVMILVNAYKASYNKVIQLDSEYMTTTITTKNRVRIC